jgi:hypothetical protein
MTSYPPLRFPASARVGKVSNQVTEKVVSLFAREVMYSFLFEADCLPIV